MAPNPPQEQRLSPAPKSSEAGPAKEGLSLETFVERLTQSGLMSGEEVQGILAHYPAEQRPTTAQHLAQDLHRQGKLTKFQAQAVYQGKTRGLVVGNYVVLDSIGKGGMGHVYKAQHKRMKRVVALKALPTAATKSPDAVQRFQREVEAAAKLSHPNIVTAYDADEAQGIYFLVMEYVDGQDLASRVKQRGRLPVAEAVEAILQAAKGLEYAHSQGVTHRDIKPANLLRDAQGTVKVLDMGLARISSAVGPLEATQDQGLTQSGQVMGTLDYMSPEQALDPRKADARADIYSLGCTLYYLLTGQGPYRGDTLTQKLLAHREQPIPALRDARPDVPPSLDALFQRMVAKRPEDRLQTMTDVVFELQHLSSAGPEAPPLAWDAFAGDAALPETLNTPASGLSDTAGPPPLGPDLGPSFLGESIRGFERYLPSRRPTPGQQLWRAVRRLVGRGGRAADDGPPLGVRGLIALAAAGVVAVVVLLGVVLSLRTSAGTLVVEIHEPDVVVQVLSEQGRVVIERRAGKGKLTLGVDPGKHRLRLEKDGVEIFAQDFTIASGGKEIIKATLQETVARTPPPGVGKPEPPKTAKPEPRPTAPGQAKLPPGQPKVLFFTRTIGYEHDVLKRRGGELSFADKTLVELGKRGGFDVDCSKDGSVFDGNLDSYAALVFYVTGDVTQPGPTPPMTAQGKRRLLDAIAAGKGFVGIHAATDSFRNSGPAGSYTLDPYLAMLGGEFAGHGPIQRATLRVTDPSFPGLAGLPPTLQLDDEWYLFKNYAPDLHVILLQETAGMKGAEYQCPPYPATWARLHQKGRVFFTSCGHHETALKNPVVQQIISAGIAWALGRTNADVTPNLARLTGGPAATPSTATPSTAKPPADAPGVVNLFDGQTLNGWHSNGAGRWTVEKGAIVGRLSQQKGAVGHLISNAEYGDFTLRMKVKVKGDSGVYVRGQEVAPDGMNGLQVNLYTPSGIGELVEVLVHPVTVGRRVPNPVNRIKEYFRADDWNDLAVTVLGPRVAVEINGTQVAELPDCANRSSGKIALQMYEAETEVMFKDIRLELGPVKQPSPPTAVAGGWQELFRRDLSGWTVVGDPGWSVANGVLTANGKGAGWLASPQDYTDFEFECEFRLPPDGNSGVFVHAWPEGPTNGGRFVEIQLLDDTSPKYANSGRDKGTGSIWSLVAPQPAPRVGAGQWHRMNVRAAGRRLSVTVDGTQVLDTNLDDCAAKFPNHEGLKRTSGRLGLQMLRTGVEFRNVRIRP